jgi:cysteine desulfurase/selenocysteine lyase
MVIDAMTKYYTGFNANIHRGIHTLAEEATAAFEATRDDVREYIGCRVKGRNHFYKRERRRNQPRSLFMGAAEFKRRR